MQPSHAAQRVRQIVGHATQIQASLKQAGFQPLPPGAVILLYQPGKVFHGGRQPSNEAWGHILKERGHVDAGEHGGVPERQRGHLGGANGRAVHDHHVHPQVIYSDWRESRQRGGVDKHPGPGMFPNVFGNLGHIVHRAYLGMHRR